MGRDRRRLAARAAAPPVETASLWFHPQRGVFLAIETPHRLWARRGGSDADWRCVATLRLAPRATPREPLQPAPGQRLPAGFVWADPTKQSYGLGGPYVAYGPLQRTCSVCSTSFTWSAAAQKKLYETDGANIDVIVKRCLRCTRAVRDLEARRRRYADALRTVAKTPTAAAHLAVATSALELLEAGGYAPIDKALGHCRRARRLGAREASASAVEAALVALRAARAGRK